ncbi:C40 family peptidase [Streptomyces doudnae]|uniref:NlpC/P60 family protein n=3 Tax=Streptomyces TaxID=1883 RepID=A0ABD5F226_9ACTN|nr:NlpC/P60 family protein [Streptomyces sp. DSM 41981]MDT0439884.1 NlpC/P60 family protein [Streptomyces sp. DSM 41981]
MTTIEEGPSREEVRRRVNTLYDRAESDSGTFNATRAMSTGSRRRGAQGGGRGDDLETVTRRLFDAARSSVGPTLPAVLPADRMPARPAPRPARTAEPLAPEQQRERPALPGARAVPELPAAGPVPELTARTVAALPPAAPAPRATAAGPGPEPAMAPTAILPAIPEPRRGSAADALPPALAPAAPVAPSPAAPTSRQPSRQAAMRRAKEDNRRKVATARELMARHLAQRTGPLPTIAPAPAERTATGQTSFTTAAAGQTPFATPATGQTPFATPAAEQTSFTTPAVPQPSFQPVPTAPAAQAQTPQTSFPQGFQDLQAHQAEQPRQAYPQPAFLPTEPQQQLPDTPFYFGDSQQADAQTSFETSQPSFETAPASFATAQPSFETARSSFETAPPAAAPWTQSAEQARRAAEEEWRLRQPSVLDTGIGRPAAAAAPAREAGTATKADRAVAFARDQIGRPCVWGAAGPGSYDNGTLVQAAWRSAGVALPRLAHEQAGSGTIVPLAEARPGDLIFFHDNFSHVGLYTGNGLMIHAPGPGAAIREESAFYAGDSALRIAVRPA